MSPLLLLGLLHTLLLLTGEAPGAHGWGHVFLRFSPELLERYGHSGRRNFGQNMPLSTVQNSPEMAATAALKLDRFKNLCSNKRCFSNQECCEEYVCVEPPQQKNPVSGVCAARYSQSVVTGCANGDLDDCESAKAGTKLYYEPCSSSVECDATRGLCCQILRQHRRAPRMACAYFGDPLMCIGPVPRAAKNLAHIEHTAGEKRLTSRFYDLQHLA